MSLRKLVFARYGWLPPIRFLAREAEKTVKAYRNQDYDMRRNGELDLLRRLRRTGFFPAGAVLFDVGANVGDWTIAALRVVPGAGVWCFEMMPETAEALRRRIGSEKAVTIVESALADRNGEMTAARTHDSQHARLVDETPDAAPVALVPVTTGDAWMRANDIGRIDFLKIDVEGWSLHVLRGFEQALARGAVRAIQFEYNLCNIRTRTFLADIYDFLAPMGYVIGKIFPGRIEFSPWSAQLEDFRGPNFFAVLNDPDRPAILR